MGASEVKRQDLSVTWCLAVSLLAGSLLRAQVPAAPFPGFPGSQPVQAPPQPAPQPAAQPAPQQQAPAPPAAAPAQTAPAQPAPGALAPTPGPAPVRIGNLSLQNASLTEVIDQLARQLHINYILDPP